MMKGKDGIVALGCWSWCFGGNVDIMLILSIGLFMSIGYSSSSHIIIILNAFGYIIHYIIHHRLSIHIQAQQTHGSTTTSP